MQTLQQGSSGRLIVDSVTNIGPHYARTLREWRRRFLAKFESVIVPALQAEYPEVMSGQRGRQEIEVFKRKWICACFLNLLSLTAHSHYEQITSQCSLNVQHPTELTSGSLQLLL